MRNPFAMVSKQCIDLVKKMLIKDPSQRITTTDALNHPFFNILGDLNIKGPPSVFEVPQHPRNFNMSGELEEESSEEFKGLNSVPEVIEDDQ